MTDTSLIRIDEAAIAKHQASAQALVTKFSVMDADTGQSATEIAGTGRRFVNPVSAGGLRRAREVELAKTVAAVTPGEGMLTPRQHGLLYAVRRAAGIGLATADNFAAASGLDALLASNARAALSGADADRLRSLNAAAAQAAMFSAA
nr:AAA family ATPase [Rhizobiaceae bacterium]